MNEKAESHLHPPQTRQWEPQRHDSKRPNELPRPATPTDTEIRDSFGSRSPLERFDFLSLIESSVHRWRCLTWSGFAGAFLGLLLGLLIWKTQYTASAQLICYETPAKGESITSQSIANMMQAPELLRRISAQANPPITPAELASRLKITTERNSEVVTVTISGENARIAVDWLNLYLKEAVPFSTSLRPILRLSQLSEKSEVIREELVSLLARYTEAHPLVQQQRAKLAAIEKQIAEGGSNPSNPALDLGVSKLPDSVPNAEPGPGYFRILTPATLHNVSVSGRWLKILFLSVFGALSGALLAIPVILALEIMDNRLKTAADVKRITHLPLLAALGNLHRMKPSSQTSWAFRTWTALQAKLRLSPNHGLVCGIVASSQGEGVSTWVSLLAQAASQRGLRVLTIGTTPSSKDAEISMKLPDETHAHSLDASHAPVLASDVLASPAEITQKLIGPNPQPHIHIPLPGWVWNIERRKQWQAALNHWRKIDNLVILVELPPASLPESVLLSENLPNLIWLTDSGTADAGNSMAYLETLRHAQCNLVGAILNHEPSSTIRNRFPRWFGSLGMLLMLMSSVSSAQESPTAPFPSEIQESRSFSVETTARPGNWQQNLTLGPGDVLNFSLYGQPELARKEVFIGPDGRVSYLEAHDVLALGLTIDELRDKIDKALSVYHRTPRTIITPVAFRSKKYFVLGGVVQKGAYTFEYPLTVIEAVARARGLETGLSAETGVEPVDLSHSFLARRGKRIPIDFEKLFREGDLSQNVALEPGDYLYFPAGSPKEVYVFGEVGSPGLLNYSQDMTAIGAISGRGGFTDRAWTQRILVVRGSLHHPETFVVDARAILSAENPDFKLQPKDIVFVSNRPWIKAEELLDTTASAFIQAVIIYWTGGHIGPILR